MPTLDVIRHASTRWNEAGLIQGRRDVPLSERGRAEAAAWRVPTDVAADAEWVSSPLTRAIDTAECIAGRRPAIAGALVEMDWGQWEGHSLAELRSLHGEAMRTNERRGLDFRPPGGESPREVLARVLPWLRERARERCPTIAVTHKGVLRVLLVAATGWDMTGKPPVRLLPATMHRLSLDASGTPTLVRCNIPLATSAAL